MDEKRKQLPIYAFKEEIINAVRDNSVVIAIGETGCGKTTQISQYLLDEWERIQKKKKKKKEEDDKEETVRTAQKPLIGVTNPRRVGAVSVARRVAFERGWSAPGGEVGYEVRFTNCTSAETRIKYVTDGCLLRECVRDPLLRHYSVIVLDEAHERSINTDVLFGLLKTVVRERPRDFKLLITSATLDSERFSTFFGGCPVLRVPGRTFPVTVINLEPSGGMELSPSLPSQPGTRAARASSPSLSSSITDIRTQITNLAPMVDVVTKIHILEKPGDVLVFLTGQEEIQRGCKEIEERMQQIIEEHPEQVADAQDMIVLPLYAALPPEEQIAVFEPAPPGTRKVVLATNIAETSLTIDGIVYVVDLGYVKQKWYNPRLGLDTLRVALISKTAAQQRAGRAGRTRPGKCFRLYSKELFADLEAEAVPEIKRSSLHGVALYLKVLGVSDLGVFDFFDPPEDAAIADSLVHLYHLGALDRCGAVTDTGRCMAQFPLEPVLSRILIESSKHGCAGPVASIVAMLSVENVFIKPSQIKLQKLFDEAFADIQAVAEKVYGVGGSDHFLLLYTYEAWDKSSDKPAWCKRHFVSSAAMHMASQIRAQLLDSMRVLRMPLGSAVKPSVEAIMRCLCAGYAAQTAKRQGTPTKSGAPLFLLNDNAALPPVMVHPGSAMFGRKWNEASVAAEWVLFHSLTWTSRGFMRNVTPVEWDWIRPFYEASSAMDLRTLVGDSLFTRLQKEGSGDNNEVSALKRKGDVNDGDEGNSNDNDNEDHVKKKLQKMIALGKVQRSNSDEAIEAAKKRFLERKKKMANKGAKKK